MPARRPILNRFVIWSLAIILLLASYVAGEPFVTTLAVQRCRPAIRVAHAVYGPLRAYRMHELPCAASLRSYSLWGTRTSIPWFTRHPLPTGMSVMIGLDEGVYDYAVNADGTLAPKK